MDYNELRKLIERYWQCETNLDEEMQIAELFKQNSNLPDDLEKWRKWFSGVQDIAVMPDKEFDKRILEAIDSGNKRKSFFFPTVFYRITIAASIAFLIFIGLRQDFQSNKSSNEMTDAEVVMTVKTLLLFTSSEMNLAENKAKEQLKTTNLMNDIINISYYE